MKTKTSYAVAALSIALMTVGLVIPKRSVQTAPQQSGNDSSSAADLNELPESGYDGGYFRNEHYYIYADEGKWEFSDQPSADCTFIYRSEDKAYSTAKLNVVSIKGEEYLTMGYDEYIETVEKNYTDSGFEVVSSKETELGGREVYEIVTRYSADDEFYTLRQVLIPGAGALTAVSYNISDKAKEELEPELEKILESFTLIE